MSEASSKTILIYDHGSFTGLAERLVRDFKKVLYFSPWVSAFPRLADSAIGEGLDGVTRIYDFWDAISDADVVCFPDVYDGDIQDYLAAQGIPVWGSRGAGFLELDRIQAREEQEQLGLAVPKTDRIVGLENLRLLLESTDEDLWVKISTFRDDFETFHHESPFKSSTWLDVLGQKFGPMKDEVEFVVEHQVEGTEVGWDCHTVDGEYPKLGMVGLEAKDRGLLGSLVEFQKLPEGVRNVYEKLAEPLRFGSCRNYLTIEMRLDKKGGTPTIIDPCVRFGSPASEGWMEMVGNLGEIIWQGSRGKIVEVEPVAKYCAQAVLHSSWALKNWTPIDIPDTIRQWVKIKNHTRINGDSYYVPGHSEMAEIGVVVGLGDTLDEAIALCEERGSLVTGHLVDALTGSLAESSEAVEEIRSLGVPF